MVVFATPALAAPPAKAVPAVTPPGACGSVLLAGSAWLGGHGVDVRSNGLYEGTGTDCVPRPNNLSYVGRVLAGEKWQCVELINRLYLTRGWTKVTWSGNAGTDFWDHVPSNLVKFQQAQGSVSYLGPGDVVITGDHALIDNDPSPVTSGTVHLVSQNAGNSTNATYQQTGTISGGKVTVGTSQVQAIGVVHAPSNSNYNGDIVQSSSDTSTQKTSWRVGADGKRHWIQTIPDYSCLKNGGVPGPTTLPKAFLDLVLPVSGSQAWCGANVNGDGSVDITDLSILLKDYGTPGKNADINLDGTVNIFDLSIMLSQWGTTGKPVTIKPPAAGAALQPPARTRRAALAGPVKRAQPRQVSGTSSLGGNDVSAGPSVSADGNIVVFSSLASNLVAGDTNGVLDVFAWNRLAGRVIRVSVDANGNQFNTPSGDAKVSPNGRYVAFDSGGDVYLKDLQTGALERISQPNSDPAGEPDQPAYANGVTSSGLVIFQSKATNLVTGDTNGAFDVFVRQLQDAPIEQVSVSSDAAGGVEGNADSYSGAASDDGRHVLFASRATNLAAGNSNGQAGIFVRDLVTGTTTLVSGPPGGGQADGDADFPSISSNGQLVAFSSDATNLAAGNPGGYQQVYVQNLAAGTLQRASQTNGGTAGNGDSTEAALSGDGSRVAFRSIASNLATGDTNGADDVFVQDLARHLISRVSVTAKLAQANSSSFGPSLNNDGTIIAFPSDATNLTGSAAGTPEQVIARDITQLPLSGATPTITGTAKVGDALKAHPGKWGPSGVQLRYQWSASGTAITGATAATLKLAAAQQGKRITVKVTASLTGYATATLASKATAKVAAGTVTAAMPR